jgi:hypothetical protein
MLPRSGPTDSDGNTGGFMVPSPAQPELLSKRSTAATVGVALGIGLLVGIATYYGQGVMPGQWNTLVNSGAIWLVAPFFVGARVGSRRLAAALGLAVLLATVAGYYVVAGVSGAPMSTWTTAFWFAVALVAGPLYGVAGRWWHDEKRTFRVIGVALLGGILVAEGLYLMLVLHYFWSGGVMFASGLIATALLARRGDRLMTLAALPVPALAAGAVYGLLNVITQLRTV